MVDAAPQLRGCPHVKPTLLAARGKNWQTAERFRPDGQISCPEISTGLLCTQLWNESPIRDVVQPSRLRTIPPGTAGKHSAVHMPHIFLLSNSFPDTLDVFPAEQFRIYIKKTDSFIRDRRKSVVTGSDYSVWWILLSYVQGE